MADIIHMDSEQVKEVGLMLGRMADKILDVQTEVSRAAQGMDWDGSGKGYFLQDVEIWAGKMYGLAQRYTEKGSAVTKEKQEWEAADKEFVKRYTPVVKGDGGQVRSGYIGYLPRGLRRLFFYVIHGRDCAGASRIYREND
jgi:hypothetical protein